jgi:protein TonB
MSNVSIYDKNWMELVFEGKNKAYGAYQLRRDNSRTTLMALLLGILFFASIAGVIILVSSFTTADAINKPVLPDEIIVARVYVAPKRIEPKKKVVVLHQRKEQVKEKVISKDLVNPTIVKKEDHPEDVTENKNTKEHQPETDVKGTNGVGPATLIPSDGEEGGKGKGVVERKGGDDVNKTTELDVMPEFPGGIKEFQKYISRNIDKPEIDESKESITAIVSFVIEKDGGLSDIKVLRSNDADLERAAVKVLRSLHTKWKPGIKDGVFVRTLYIQPIRIAL